MTWPGLLPLLVAVLTPLTVGSALVVADRVASVPSPQAVRWVGALAATLTAAATAATVWRRPELDVPWIPALGVRIDLAVDGISAPLLLLTAVAALVVGALPYHPPEEDPSDRRHPERSTTAPLPTDPDELFRGRATYYGCLLLVLAGALLTFLTRDAVVFFVAFELVLVPMWVLVARHGDATRRADRDGAALRFVLVTVTGSTLMLVGILGLATRTGTTDLDRWQALAGGEAGPADLALAVLLLLGLGIKVPVWPLHTWLPWVHATAPTTGSVLLAAVLLKMGVYGMVRLVIAPMPEAFATLAPVLAGLAVTGIIWAGLACLVERDLKRLIAWSSIAHLGFVVLALTAGTEAGLQAALFGNVAHGLISALLFVVVGELKRQWGGADLATARAALREVTPRLGFALVVGMAAAMGLPGLAGFWGEVGALYAAWAPAQDRSLGWFRGFTVAAAAGAALGAAYGARVLREVWAGDRTTPALRDARRVTALVLAALVTAVVGLGVYPSALLDLTAGAVGDLLAGSGVAR